MDEPGVPLLVRLQVRGQRMTVWALLRGEGLVLGLSPIAPTARDEEGRAEPRRNPDLDYLLRGTVHDTTNLHRWISSENTPARGSFAKLMVSRGLAERNDLVQDARVLRSDHLGHTQVCDCQLEVALVEYLCVCFLAARGFDRVQLVLVPLNRFGVVEGRRGHATTGRSVD